MIAVAADSWCESRVPPHPKSARLDWDLVNVKAVWTVNSMSCSRNGYTVVIEGSMWSAIMLRHLDDAQLTLRGPQCAKHQKSKLLTGTLYSPTVCEGLQPNSNASPFGLYNLFKEGLICSATFHLLPLLCSVNLPPTCTFPLSLYQMKIQIRLPLLLKVNYMN